MRKRMAYRKRVELLRRGAVIIEEGRIKDDNGRYYPEGYCVNFNYLGWKVSAPGDDMLEAYNGALFAASTCEEDPRE